MSNDSAGIGDPYFYEWTLGQQKILEMLNPDNGIKSVVLQKNGFVGLDDVVINYHNKAPECIQVKHTRVEDSLTFNDLVYSYGKEEALLKQLAAAWAKAESDIANLSVRLASNRKIGTREATKEDGTKLPRLEEFWSLLKQQVDQVKSVDELKFDDKYLKAVEAFKNCLSDIAPEKKLKFLTIFNLECGISDLTGLENQITEQITKVFGVNANQAIRIFSSFDHSLRNWVTSRRRSEEITPEMVLNELCKGQNDFVGDHEIAPPAPFFPTREKFLKQLANSLLDKSKCVTFLYGVPGSGKTSIVSSLANHISPSVHFRFHAFRPISPENKLISTDISVVCSPEALWGDLLNQMRGALVGRYAKYKVPIINSFLSTEEQRAHFMRLATAYSEELGCRIVVAIDGIDHAARAGVEGKKLLDSLLEPDAIPEQIHFVIAGQPADSYPAYPYWLRTTNPKVQNFEVPLLEEEDVILLLCSSKVELSGADQTTIAKFILEKSGRNTLPVVFASYEAQQCKTFPDFESRLNLSKLSGKLGQYYDGIWQNLVTKLGENSDTKQVRIATALCLLSQKISPLNLANAFSDLNTPEAFWKDQLVSLYPLVVNDEGGYRVLHNDIRIYLNLILKQKETFFRDAAKHLVEFIKDNSSFAVCRHADLENLLVASGEEQKILEFITPHFVSEGWSFQRSHLETSRYLKRALAAAIEQDNWGKIHSVVMAMDTMRQLLRITQTSDFNNYKFEHLTGVIETSRILPVEKYVAKPGEWSLILLSDVFDGIRDLWGLGEIGRAKALFERWFTSFDLSRFLQILTEEEIYGHHENMSDEFKKTVASLGYWSAVLDSKCFNFSCDEEDQKELKWIYAALLSGRADGAARKSIYQWARQLRKTKTWYSDDIEETLDYLFTSKKWAHIRVFCRVFGKNFKGKALLKLNAYAILAGEKNQDNFKEVLKSWKTSIKSENNVDIEEHFSYFWIAFCIGYLEPTRPLLGITEEVLNEYFSTNRDDRKKSSFGRITFASALLGQLFNFKSNNKSIVHLEADIKRVINSIFSIYEDKGSIWLHNLNGPVRLILSGLKDFRNLYSNELSSMFSDKMMALAATRPGNGYLQPLWHYLVEENKINVLEEYYDYYFSDDGIAWEHNAYERMDFVSTFKPLAKIVNFDERIKKADKILSEKSISFDSHKDYSMANPLSWLRLLNKTNEKVEVEDILKFLAVNKEASELGDNRISYDVKTEIFYEAVKKGPKACWEYLNLNSSKTQEKWFDFDNSSFFDGLIKALKHEIFSDDDVLALWCLCIGGLSWQNDDDQATIEYLREAILINVHRSQNARQLHEKLVKFGKTELKIKGKEYHRKKFWFTKEKEEKDSFLKDKDISKPEEVINFLVGSLNSENKSTVFRDLCFVFNEAKRGNQLISKELAEKVLYEGLKISYGSTWYYDGLDDLIESVGEHIVDKKVFTEFLKESLKKTEEKTLDNLGYWVEAVSSNLDYMCRHRDFFVENELLSIGFKNWLNLMEFWISGNSASDLDIPVFDTDTSKLPNSWTEFVFKYLSVLLTSDVTEQVYSALRGLWALLNYQESLVRLLPEIFFGSSLDIRMKILLLCERICFEKPSLVKDIEPILAHAHASDNLGESLQGWVCRSIVAKRAGLAATDWKFARKERKYDDLEIVPAIITDGHQMGSITFSSSFSAVELLLKHLAVYLDLDIDEIVSGSMSLSDEETVVSPYLFKRLRWSMRRQPDSDIANFYNFFGDFFVEEEPSNGLAEILSNSILKSDDPFLILESPNYFNDHSKWQVTDEIGRESSVAEDLLIQQAIEAALSAEIEEHFVLLGGYSSQYTRKYDYHLESAYRPKVPLQDISYDRISTSFNGRFFAMDFSDVKHPIRGRKYPSSVWKAGGLTEYWMLSAGISSYVIASLNLNQHPSDPRIWHNNKGEVVLKFEQIVGPIRSETREPYYRQPIIQRWIIKEDALLMLLKNIPDLEFRKWHHKIKFEME